MIFLLSLTGDVTFDIPLRKLQPRPQGLLLVQNGGSENYQSGSKNSLKFRRMSSLRLNNGFRLQKTNRVARRWKQPPKKTLTVHHVSRDKILHDSWSFQQPWPGFLRSIIFNEEKALGTRLRPLIPFFPPSPHTQITCFLNGINLTPSLWYDHPSATTKMLWPANGCINECSMHKRKEAIFN